jgi:hypothetical protein
MQSLDLDPHTADRLVAGLLDRDDAAPEYRRVVDTLSALRRPPEPTELGDEADSVARIAHAVVAARDHRASHRRRSLPPVLKLATAAAVGVLALTGGLAAAGALGPAQRVASTVLDTVGISVPDGDGSGNPVTPNTTSGTRPNAPRDGGSTPAIGSNQPGAQEDGPDHQVGPNPGGPHPSTPGGPRAPQAGGARPHSPNSDSGGGPPPNVPPNPGAGHGRP